MSSLLGSLQSTLSGMKVAQTQLGVISSNISNANNEDYTRKTVNTESISLSNGSGGVTIAGYSRAVDDVLDKSYNTSIATASMTGTQVAYFSQLKDLYGISTDNTQLDTLSTNFNNAWQAYAATPDSAATQIQLVASGKALASEIQRLSSGLSTADNQIKQATSDDVDAVNGDLKDIAALNAQISSAVTANGDAGSYEDERDAKLRDLSQYVSIQTFPAANGQVRITTSAGYTLLDQNPLKLAYNGTTITDAATGQDLNSSMTGGSLEALVNFRANSSPATASTDSNTEVIRKLQDQLNAVANNLLTTTGSPATFAAAYNGATAATGELTAGFFTGTDASTIAVNSSLLNGTATVKQASGDAVYTALTATGRTTSAGNVTITNGTYSDYINQVFSTLGQASASATSDNDLATATRDAYKQRVSATSGVNTDEELVNLTQIQNSYAVSAHVISVINTMYDTLVGILQ